jgi:hypothetical protein
MNSDLSTDRNEREQPLSSGRGFANDGGGEAKRGRWMDRSTGHADNQPRAQWCAVSLRANARGVGVRPRQVGALG